MSPWPHAIRASAPWGRSDGEPEESQREEAAREPATYHCDREGCPFTPFSVPFAASVTPPPAWPCRCGRTARLDGAPQDAEVVLPGYGQATGGPAKGGKSREDITPMGQLRKRRSKKDGAAILAEAMERARQSGAAR